VGLERDPLSLVSTTEELLGRNSSGSGLEIREYCRRDSSRWPCGTLYPQRIRTNFADKRQSLGRYSSLADWGQGVFFIRKHAWYGITLALLSWWLERFPMSTAVDTWMKMLTFHF
jgi:hypothetical protein